MIFKKTAVPPCRECGRQYQNELEKKKHYTLKSNTINTNQGTYQAN